MRHRCSDLRSLRLPAVVQWKIKTLNMMMAHYEGGPRIKQTVEEEKKHLKREKNK